MVDEIDITPPDIEVAGSPANPSLGKEREDWINSTAAVRSKSPALLASVVSPPTPLRSATVGGPKTQSGPTLVPCLLLKEGHVFRPGPDGPEPARTPAGAPLDPFDVVDRLVADYSLLYVVDLDGIEHGNPQLDYLQEISRDMALWVDAGVRTADQAIDILVAGARRAVLSSAYLRSPKQLHRAWRLSSELVFEIELDHAHVAPTPGDWGTVDPAAFARRVREVGPDHVVLSPRETEPDWSIVRTVAAEGPTWIDGSFSRADTSRLAESGAAGGIFHLDELFDQWKE